VIVTVKEQKKIITEINKERETREREREEKSF
jgi:heme exporter protein D